MSTRKCQSSLNRGIIVWLGSFFFPPLLYSYLLCHQSSLNSAGIRDIPEQLLPAFTTPSLFTWVWHLSSFKITGSNQIGEHSEGKKIKIKNEEACCQVPCLLGCSVIWEFWTDILSGWSKDLLPAECSFWSLNCVYLLVSVEATSVLINKSQSSPCALKDKWFGIVGTYSVKFLVSSCKQDGLLHTAPWSSPSAYANPELLLCTRALTSTSQSHTQSEHWQLLSSSSEPYNRMAMGTELTHALALLNLA